MFGYSTISSENDCINISAQLVKDHLGNWIYSDPAISIYSVGEDSYRNEKSKILVVWDYEPFLREELYKEVYNFCEARATGEDQIELESEIDLGIKASGVDPLEFLQMLDQAIDLGMIQGVSRNPFKEINEFISGKK